MECSSQPIKVGDWVIEPELNQISWEGRQVSLRPQAMDLLVYLACHKGQVVSADTLIDDVWDGVNISNGSVYNCINQLRQALGDSKRAPRYIETISKRGYRLVAPTSGISVPQKPKDLLNGASIAVLPFVNLSSDTEQEYFSDGISEELLNLLAKVPTLRVAARTSSFQFKGINQDSIKIGQQLHVAHLLEGSVRKAGSKIRITAQLIDARNGFHLWSETYDRQLENIFAIQNEISAAIVEKLKEHLDLQVVMPPTRVAPPVNLEAHDACLRGKYLISLDGAETSKSGVREFQNAIALAPEYALAHAELVIATMFCRHQNGGHLNLTEAAAQALPHAMLALKLDPGLAEAHTAMGWVLWVQGKLEESLSSFQEAVRLNPNYALVYLWMGVLLGNEIGQGSRHDMGRYKEAFAMREISVRLDPLSFAANNYLIKGLIARNRLDEARCELDKLAPISPACYANKIGVLTSLGGKWSNAVLANLDAIRIEPAYHWIRPLLAPEFAVIGLEQEALVTSNAPLPIIWSLLGKPNKAALLAQQLRGEEPASPHAESDLGIALAGAGNYDRAGPILENVWRITNRVTAFGLFRAMSAAALIAIRRSNGDEIGIEELLAAIQDNVRRSREANISVTRCFASVDFEEGLAAYLTGDKSHGLELISKAVEQGYFILPNEAYLEELYAEPEFAPIRSMQETRQASELKKFLSEISLDNPYSAIWNPCEETLKLVANSNQ